MRIRLSISRVFLVTILMFSITTTQAQNSTDQKLYEEIARMDSILFNAFNIRDTDRFKSFFTTDLEFYHDKGGLTGYQHTVDFLKEISKAGNDLTRELLKETLEVYPIPGYGAMEIGAHRFCHTENGKQECGTFMFVHIWQKQNNEWKISRVVSYGH